jgi:hypothetical protein
MGRVFVERVLRNPRAGVAVVLAVFALVYGRAAGHDFVWDDLPNIVENAYYDVALGEALRSTQLDHMDPELLGTVGLPMAYESYRPLLFLSYRLDAAVFERSPLAMHVHNLLLGALIVALAGWIFAQLLSDPRAALLATAVFALHPLQTEVLCYVSARGGLLSTLLALLATAAYWAALAPDASVRRRILATLAAAVAFLASLAVKEAWMTLPLALAGLAHARGRLRTAALPLAVLCVVPCVYFALRVLLIGSELSGVDPEIGLRALANAPAHALAYLRIFVAPYDLSIERLGQTNALARGAGWIFWGAVCFAVLRGVPARRPGASAALRLAAAGLLWFAVLLVPATVPMETMGVRADRYAALPLFGAALALGASSGPLWRRRAAGIHALPAAAGVWALTCLVVTIGQVSVWRDNTALYAHSLLVEPGSAMAHYRLGVLAARGQRWPEALDHFENAEQLNGSHVFVLNNLGVAYLNHRRLEEAEAALQRVLAIGGEHHFRAWNNLAQVHFARAERERGCAALERSLAINPAYPFAQRNHAHFCAPTASPAGTSG